MSLASLRKKFVLDLPMRIGDHRPDTPKTLNRGSGGSELDADILGINLPTKLANRRGFYFDGKVGSDADRLRTKGSIVGSSDALTVAFTYRIDGPRGTRYLGDHRVAGGSINWLALITTTAIRIYVGAGSTVNSASWVTSADDFEKEQTLIGVWDGTNTLLYIDGILRATAPSPVAPVGVTEQINIGSNVEGAQGWLGNIYHHGFANKAFSPLDAKEYHYWMSRLCGRAREAA